MIHPEARELAWQRYGELIERVVRGPGGTLSVYLVGGAWVVYMPDGTSVTDEPPTLRDRVHRAIARHRGQRRL